MAEPLCLVTIHAHPDDESSKGAPTVARYVAEGVRCVLVCCTGGEEGEILNPAMESDEVRSRLPTVRLQELEAATKIIGFTDVEMLGYRDSGMAGMPSNENPAAFAQAPEEEAVGKVVKILRTYRPQVVLCYGDDQELYPHPDHLRVHDVSVAAFAAASDPRAYPDCGPPWEPKKLYYSVLSHARIEKLIAAFEALKLDWPLAPAFASLPNRDHRITTRVDVSQWAHVRNDALRAHATQIDPESPFWFGLPPDLEEELNGEDEYVLAHSSVETSLPETDLFSGLR